MKNWMKTFAWSLISLVLVSPVVTSCYDDEAIWDKFKDLENKINSLEVELNGQVAALNALLSDLTTISDCKKNDDGSYTVTLSNGTKFNVLPEGTDFSSFVTYKVIEGKKYWATYDATGEAVLLTDASGKPVPVSTELSVTLKDGVYYLVINGKEYATGYDAEDVVQVFSSCTPLTDASGNVYAVKFTLGEGMTTTIALDGYTGVLFKVSNINNTVLSDYYVGYGETQSLYMEMPGVVDYVMQVPDGWRVKEVVEELTGETYVEITAPSEETVALGAAVSDGDLKVVSVVEGGKAAISKIYLSTDPFKTYNLSALKAVIETYTGIEKFAYGMMCTDDFNKDVLIESITNFLTTGSELPVDYRISEKGINLTYAEILGEDVSAEKSYVFWVIPILYQEEGEAGYYVVEDMLRTKVMAPISATVEVSNITLLNAQIKAKVDGTLSMYAGISLMSDTVFEEVAYQINNELITPLSVLSYDGLASEFPIKENAMNLDPATSYVAWVVPVDAEKTEYTKEDVVYKSFTTLDISAGGTITAEVGELAADCSSISTTISSENAAMIYYAYLPDEDGKRYSTASNDVKMEKLLSSANFDFARGTTVKATIDYIRPETTMWLYAVAIGHDGLYGEVVCKSATTEEVSFNDISLSVELLTVSSDEATVKVTATGGEILEYVYWVGYSEDNFWKNKDYCGYSKSTAQEYIAANPDAEQIVSVMKHNGTIAEDGTLTLTDLNMSTDYIFVVLAKDASGLYSKAGYRKFTTLAADLGTIAHEGSDKWNDALSKVNIKWIKEAFLLPENSNMSASYAFEFSGPTDLTAYIMCASSSFFEGMKLNTVEERIVYVEDYASRKYDNGYVPFDENGDMMTEPDYYKDGVLKGGQLMNVYDYYVHGLPAAGFVTYFADGDHDGNCIYWDNDKCSYYERALERIAYYNTIVPYREKADLFNLVGDEAEAWAQALLKAYKPFYENAKPIIYYNEGGAVKLTNPYASGVDSSGQVIDRVIVVFRDLQGNYYAPMSIEVPNYFK